MTQKYVNGELVNLTSEEETQISNDISKNATENAATGYIMNRRTGVGNTSGYDTITNQLDQLYHDMKDGKLGVAATTGSWYVGITSVKTSFPKPS